MIRIEHRWPVWSKWRIVKPSPHGEKHQFDAIGLYFNTVDDANKAMRQMKRANAGEYRIRTI